MERFVYGFFTFFAFAFGMFFEGRDGSNTSKVTQTGKADIHGSD